MASPPPFSFSCASGAIIIRLSTPQVWVAIEAASHQAMMLLGKARAQLSALQSLADCRVKLRRRLMHRGLSALEVHLLANPAAMGRTFGRWRRRPRPCLSSKTWPSARACFATGCRYRGSGSQKISKAHIFHNKRGNWISFMGCICESCFLSPCPLQSVILEEAKARGMDGWLRACPPSSPSSAAADEEAQVMLESLQQLPDCGSRAAQKLLDHLDHQLQLAVEAAGPRLSAARTGRRKVSGLTEPSLASLPSQR